MSKQATNHVIQSGCFKSENRIWNKNSLSRLAFTCSLITAKKIPWVLWFILSKLFRPLLTLRRASVKFYKAAAGRVNVLMAWCKTPKNSCISKEKAALSIFACVFKISVPLSVRGVAIATKAKQNNRDTISLIKLNSLKMLTIFISAYLELKLFIMTGHSAFTSSHFRGTNSATQTKSEWFSWS